MPQTAASLEQRSLVFDAIAKRSPDVTWRLCMREFDPLNRMGHYSRRPRWRKDAEGFGKPRTTWAEIMPFKEKALTVAINWPAHNAKTLGAYRVSSIDA